MVQLPNDITHKAATGKQSIVIYFCRQDASFTAGNYAQAVDFHTGSMFLSTTQSAQDRINDIKSLALLK